MTLNFIYHLTPTVATWVHTAIKHPLSDRVVIFDIRVPGCQKLQCRLNPVWHTKLYSCTHMATVGVKWL